MIVAMTTPAPASFAYHHQLVARYPPTRSIPVPARLASGRINANGDRFASMLALPLASGSASKVRAPV